VNNDRHASDLPEKKRVRGFRQPSPNLKWGLKASEFLNFLTARAGTKFNQVETRLTLRSFVAKAAGTQFINVPALLFSAIWDERLSEVV
jgi:hypothetical protein